MFDVISHDEERYMRGRRRLASVVIFLSLALFYYPHVRQYIDRWRALSATREIAAYVQRLKTESLLKKKSFEVRFVRPATIEVYSVATCGMHNNATRVATRALEEFTSGLEFLPAERVQSIFESAESTTLNRFCYDPINGSSLAADGVLHGSIYLGVKEVELGDYSVVKMTLSGSSGDIEIE